jgi:hypothetical protein
MFSSPPSKQDSLPAHAYQGWVTSNDHLIFVKWKTTVQAPKNADYKAFCERIAAEAAVMKGYTAVLIM